MPTASFFRRPLFLIGLIILVLVGYRMIDTIQYKNALKEPKNMRAQTEKMVFIKKGSSTKEIGKILEEKKIIEDANFFERYVEDIKKTQKLLAGRFRLKESLTIPEIALILSDPKKAENIITIPEGFSIQEIDERLAGMNFIKSGTFREAEKKFKQFKKYPFLDEQKLSQRKNPLEGYLFPDTYFLDAGDFSSEELIEKMLKNFEERLGRFINKKSLDDIIIVASLLEKEIKTEKDLPIVSGIIWKRVESGWFLNIDATLLYEKNNNAITKKDLEEQSPYNTYKKKGLPPGPIGNPGLKTIEAGANPEKSPFWFYITKPKTGEVIYAKTNEEQNANRAEYLK